MAVASELRDILVVLSAANVGAELSERVSTPVVVGESIAAILIGPSAAERRHPDFSGVSSWADVENGVLESTGEPLVGPVWAGANTAQCVKKA